MAEPRSLARVYELLERQHGVGARGARPSRWMQQRVEREIETIAAAASVPVADVLRDLEREPDHVRRIADALRVGETSFYRDAAQWEALRTNVLPRFAIGKAVRALSVGCSTGEEAWTLAMICSAADRPCSVVGIDRNDAALATARAAEYSNDSARHLPEDLTKRFLVPRGNGVAVDSALRPHVRFQNRDAVAGPPPGQYELVVCKNVLIYFGDAAAEAIVKRLLRALADGGVALFARSEVPRVRGMGARAEEIDGATVFA